MLNGLVVCKHIVWMPLTKDAKMFGLVALFLVFIQDFRSAVKIRISDTVSYYIFKMSFSNATHIELGLSLYVSTHSALRAN